MKKQMIMTVLVVCVLAFGAALVVYRFVGSSTKAPELSSNVAPNQPAESVAQKQALEEQKRVEFAEKWKRVAEKVGVYEAFAAAKDRLKFQEGLRTMETYQVSEFDMADANIEHLDKGVLPNFIEGDFDCDGKTDRVFLLDQYGFITAFGNGSMARVTDVDWDAIALSDDGGGDSYDGNFKSKCAYITGIKFESASRAYVYDAEKKKFAEYQTSD
jgi:hypothetical protein